MMEVEFRPDGIYLPTIGLWLDPRESKPTAWLSHGHADHAHGYHDRVFATRETLDFYKIRWPDGAAPRELQAVSFNQPFEWRGATLTALPAGHILGAAQLRVELEGEVLVYTGDIKLWPPLCGDETEVATCDRLVVESTFGLPIYHFLTREQARDSIVAFARECLEERTVPVFFGYPLGRGQEIAHVLCTAGIPTAVHGAIARYLPHYESRGYAFPGWSQYNSRRVEGAALVLTPAMRNIVEAAPFESRAAYVSGWAALHNARARAGAEELIPYSDHASFDELIDLIERSGAKHIDVVHGYAEPLARILRERGIDASAPLAQGGRSAADEGDD